MKTCCAWIVSVALIGCGGGNFAGETMQADASVDVHEASDVSQQDGADATHDDETVDATKSDADAMQTDVGTPEETGEDVIVIEDVIEAFPETGTEPAPDVCAPGSCQSLGKNCGPTPNGCGATIPTCGSCPANQLCGGGGIANVCGGCIPTSCQLEGKNCGTILDGCGNTLPCGTCTAPQTCAGGGIANVCGCTPTTCQVEGKNCGSIPDKCGGTIGTCGPCPVTQTCGGGGVPNVCGGCVPPTCLDLGKNCGAVPDGCGGTLQCGTCPSNKTCGGGGIPNVCGGCVPDTCQKHGYNCGSIPDGCGNTLVCGPAMYRLTNAWACGVYGRPPYAWSCGIDAYNSGPMPFPDCVQVEGITYAYCCPESA